jgi:hypothetical protein
MKMATSAGMVLLSTILAGVPVGDSYALQTNDLEAAETVTTNATVSMETNAPPLNTLLGSSLPEDMDPASPLGQLVRLVQAGVEQSVMLAFIKSSPRFFEMDADGIIYLSDLGTPAEVIEAVMAHDQQLFEKGIHGAESPPAETVEAADDSPPEVTVNEFYDTLSPYGTWVYIEGYGRCWRPTVVIYNSGWRPYCDNGRWVYTDRGWYWMSNYSWGWAAFHYGRWFHHASYGWCWWPDTVWAPSWVCWRYDSSYCGWAPLPPHTVYRSGVGLVYRGSSVSVGFGFNLGHSAFTFVSLRNFCDPEPRRHCIDRNQVAGIYERTTADCRFDLDQHRHALINRGIPVTRISSAVQRDIQPAAITYTRGDRARSQSRREALDRHGSSVVVNQHGSNSRPAVNRQRDGESRSDISRTNPSPRGTTPAPSSRNRSPSGPQPTPENRTDRSRSDHQPRSDRAIPPGTTPSPSMRNNPQPSTGTPGGVTPPARTSSPGQSRKSDATPAPTQTQVQQRTGRTLKEVPAWNQQVAQQRTGADRSSQVRSSGRRSDSDADASR